MMRLEDLQPNAAVRGLLPDCLVTVVSVQWFGSEALELTYKTPAGKVANELLYRHDEPRLELVEQGRPWSFDGDGSLFRLMPIGRPLRNYRDSVEPGADARSSRLFMALLDAGIMVNDNGLGCLSTPMGEAELDRIQAALERALATLAGG